MTDRCSVYGHSAQCLPCRSCESERKGQPDDTPAPVYALTPEQRATNDRGLRLVRAALTTTTEEDA